MNKFLLIENSPIIIKGFVSVLKGVVANEIEIQIANSFEELDAMCQVTNYTAVIIDIGLNEKKINDLMVMIKKYPLIPMMVFSDKVTALPHKKMYAAGLCGILDKTSEIKEIESAIELVIRGETYVSQTLLKSLILGNMDVRPIGKLTAREREIAKLLARGKRNRQIGQVLALKPSTVSTFKTKIFKKLNVKNIIELGMVGKNFYM